MPSVTAFTAPARLTDLWHTLSSPPTPFNMASTRARRQQHGSWKRPCASAAIVPGRERDVVPPRTRATGAGSHPPSAQAVGMPAHTSPKPRAVLAAAAVESALKKPAAEAITAAPLMSRRPPHRSPFRSSRLTSAAAAIAAPAASLSRPRQATPPCLRSLSTSSIDSWRQLRLIPHVRRCVCSHVVPVNFHFILLIMAASTVLEKWGKGHRLL